MNVFEDHLQQLASAVDRLRAGSGDPNDLAWRALVIESTAVFSRGMAQLVESIKIPENPLRDMNDDHLQAQRFARVRVAEMALYQSSQVKAGRSAHNLYGTLKSPIDDARAGYHQKFLTEARGIPDYLHQEMVLVLAQNDTSLLGPDYPGPLA